MPIPPTVDHGFDNLSADDHLVPFIFGSQRLGGWGIFADVEPRIRPYDAFVETPLEAPALNGSIYIERLIAAARRWPAPDRRIIVPAERTATPVTGGLELGLSQVTTAGRDWTGTRYRILSVCHGCGSLVLGPARVTLAPHDHVGIPAEMAAWIAQEGDEPLVVLDATLLPTAGAA
jgi:hypothetical protein